jgi:hypothetical protein
MLFEGEKLRTQVSKCKGTVSPEIRFQLRHPDRQLPVPVGLNYEPPTIYNIFCALSKQKVKPEPEENCIFEWPRGAVKPFLFRAFFSFAWLPQ